MRAWGLIGLLVVVTAGRAAAQRTRLTLNSGAPIAFATATEADYDAGSIAASAPLSFTVDLRSGNAAWRTTIVSIRASSASMGGSKPIADLQWRRADLASWNSLTTTDATVESRPIRRNSTNDPWTNSLLFRTLLSWNNDPPGTYAPTIVLTLTLTTP